MRLCRNKVCASIPVHGEKMREFEYAIDQGDGRWLLHSKGRVVTSTFTDEIGFCFDRDGWVMLKHGNPDFVREWCSHAKEVFGSVGSPGEELASTIEVLVGKSYPLVGEPVPGQIYFSAEDVNRCLSTAGYIKHLVAKTSALEVEATEIQPPRERA